MKILIAEDTVTIRRLIINMLKSAGYDDVIEASNGSEALSLIEGVDLVLTDWNMPVMDGLALLRAIRATPAYAHIPVIMVTGEGAREEVLAALREGASDYIVKPFDRAGLIKKVDGQMLKGNGSN